MASPDTNFDNLDRAGRAAARLSVSPRSFVYVTLAVALLVSWAILIAFASRAAIVPGPGLPGGELLALLPALPLPAALGRMLDLCLGPVAFRASLLEVFLALWLMWFLMSLAMMLPSAIPMIRTYCELADTAGLQRQAAAHPLVFISGYLAVWLAASLLFAGVTLSIQYFAFEFSRSTSQRVGAISLAAAGFYQFSALKEACLEKCRNPFAVLFSRWSVAPSKIFRLGAEQGLWCLGCCWALMLVMFAVGLMNVFWMALLGVFALAEKQLHGPVISRVAGVILLVWSAALLLLSL